MPSVNRTIVTKNKTIAYRCDDVHASIENNALFIFIEGNPTARSIKCFDALVKKAKARDGIGEVVLGRNLATVGEVPLPHTAETLRLLDHGQLSLELATAFFSAE